MAGTAEPLSAWRASGTAGRGSRRAIPYRPRSRACHRRHPPATHHAPQGDTPRIGHLTEWHVSRHALRLDNRPLRVKILPDPGIRADRLGHRKGMRVSYLLRVQLPDRPGSLGALAMALGTVGADI